MPTIATTTQVFAQLRTALHADAQAAAGNNTLSKGEQASLPPGVLPDAAAALRTAGGSGARVSVDALVDKAVDDVERLFATVNQASGSGTSSVSQAEVRALAAQNLDAGKRVARAYELITGRTLLLDEVTPAPPAPTGRLAIAGVAITVPASSPTRITATLVDATTIELKGPSVQGGGDIRVDLPGRQIVAPLGTGASPKFKVVDALRLAAPDLDVRVVQYGRGTMRLELWPAGSAPRGLPSTLSGAYTSSDPNRPGSMDFKHAGENGLNSWNVDTIPGEKLTLDVEGKRHEVVADASTPKVVDLFRAIATQLRADGWNAVVKDYSPNIYCALKIELP